MKIEITLQQIRSVAQDIIDERRHDLESSLDEVNAVESSLDMLIRHLEEVHTNG